VSVYKHFVMSAAIAAVGFVASPATSEAQGHVSVVVGGGFYAPYAYYPGLWYGAYQYPYPYGYGYSWAPPEASLRIEVKPKEAGVFVDGFYAGIVDDFDGTFQRLNVPPGEHEIELWLEGYRTVRQKVYLTANNTFKVKYQMERLPAGEAQEPKPQPLAPPPDARMQPQQQPMGRGPSTHRMPPPPPMPPQDQPQPMPDDPRGGVEAQRGGPRNAAFGTLAVKVQPADAEISIDGEAWRGPGGQDRLTVEVPEGSHTVEIRKSGYRTYVTQIDVRRGQTTPLNVSLRGEQQ
jgi:hypothetical protein